jgi:hypothetical protein
MSKKNHTLPVKLMSNGTAYPGVRRRSSTVYTAPRTFRFNQLFCGEVTDGLAGGLKRTAARRMNGVVRPHAIPTRRNPIVQRKMDGESGVGVSASMTGAMYGVLSTALICCDD